MLEDGDLFIKLCKRNKSGRYKLLNDKSGSELDRHILTG